MSIVKYITKSADLSLRRRFSIVRKLRQSDLFERPALVVASTSRGGACIYFGQQDAGGYSYESFDLTRVEAERLVAELTRLLYRT